MAILRIRSCLVDHLLFLGFGGHCSSAMHTWTYFSGVESIDRSIKLNQERGVCLFSKVYLNGIFCDFAPNFEVQLCFYSYFSTL
jgi:hypothetical protein